jgi:methyltransferase (TIGR00027 family)
MYARSLRTPNARAASKTALIAAAYRARVSGGASPLCDDPWAASLAGEEGEALAEQQLRTTPDASPPDDVLVGLRVSYLDAYVAWHSRKADGFRQVVILGAGLDTRAARLAHEGVTFYEVDHPDSQRYKIERVGGLDGYPKDATRYVPCDFASDDHLSELVASGFCAEEPSLFIMEGVAHYLTDDQIRRVLGPIASECNTKTTVLFDYLSHIREEDLPSFDNAAELGEPVLWTIRNPLPLLRELGFRHVRTTAFDQLYTSLTGACSSRESFIHTCSIARATRDTGDSPYVW